MGVVLDRGIDRKYIAVYSRLYTGRNSAGIRRNGRNSEGVRFGKRHPISFSARRYENEVSAGKKCRKRFSFGITARPEDAMSHDPILSTMNQRDIAADDVQLDLEPLAPQQLSRAYDDLAALALPMTTDK